MEVRQATISDLNPVADLFDRYRVFYNQKSDIDTSRSFIEKRLQNRDSAIFVAIDGSQIVGFTQLYPSFSSVSAKQIWVLNDLFVAETARQQGIAKSLMNAAEGFARETGAVRVALSTQSSNVAAQSLYRSRGYVKDEDFYHFSLSL